MNDTEDSITPAAPEIPATAAQTETSTAPVDEQSWTPEADEPGFLEKLGTVISRVLAVAPRLRGYDLTARAILESIGGQNLVISRAEFDRLKAFQIQHDRCTAAVNSLHEAGAKEAWLKHMASLAASISDGKVDQVAGRPLSDFVLDYEQRGQAARNERTKIYLASLPECRVICGRFISLAEKKIATMESFDRRQHSQFGVGYSPSPLITQLRKTISISKARIVQSMGGGLGPRELLPFIDWQ